MKTVGITGSRHGMSDNQITSGNRLLRQLKKQGASVLAHGDCLGVDSQAHSLAVSLGYQTQVHPPTNPRNRAYMKGDVVYKEQAYLDRNKDIVTASDVIVAFPEQSQKDRPPVKGSGTWHVIRYTRLVQKTLYIVWPDGEVEGGDS